MTLATHRASVTKMPRAASPALSENEIDILGSLLTGENETPHAKTKHAEMKDGFGFDVGELLDGDEDDGDEAFIALKQAAAFRKNTNLKGTALKKGGGFQSMGNNLPFVIFLGIPRYLTIFRPQRKPA